MNSQNSNANDSTQPTDGQTSSTETSATGTPESTSTAPEGAASTTSSASAAPTAQAEAPAQPAVEMVTVGFSGLLSTSVEVSKGSKVSDAVNAALQQAGSQLKASALQLRQTIDNAVVGMTRQITSAMSIAVTQKSAGS